MYFSTLSKISKSASSGIYTLLLTAIFSISITVSQAQNCSSPPSTLVNGNFNLPTTAIVPNSVPAINNNMPGWFVSHGTPTTQALPDRTMWMWSYTTTGGALTGEGVFNCYNFQQGQSYLICFDLQTNGKADGATVDVRASNSLSASGGGTAYPIVPNELIWQDLTVNYSINNWSSISVVYTPSSNYSQIWFHPLWTGITPGTPAPYGNPGQAEMRIDNVNISPIADPTDPCPCDLTSNFTYSTTDSACAIQFNETSAGNCCTDVVGWQWDFGDGTTATGANPLHTFPSSGTYTVCLTTVGLTDDGQCCTDSICYQVTVNCDTCECSIDADFQSQIFDCQVRFTDISTQSSCTQITGWSWDFGDGNISNAQNPMHQYGAPGTYPVCLIVYGTDGTQNCDDTICYDVPVDCEGDCPCTIDGDFTYDIDGCAVNFTGFGNSDCEIVGWSWDFGDGNTSSQQNPSHIYNNAGIYNVCLTILVKSPAGTICSETFCQQVGVEDCEDCRCAIDGDFAFDIDGCNIYFAGFGESDCEIIGWNWDFGDGNTSNQQNPVHTYSNAGTYNVCLTTVVMSPDGLLCSETFCQQIDVSECDPGIKKKSGTIEGSTSTLPFEPHLYPNPTSGTLFIEFNAETGMDLKIDVLNSAMEHVTTLVDQHFESGAHKVEWLTGENNLASGTYYVLLKSGTKVKFEKVILKK